MAWLKSKYLLTVTILIFVSLSLTACGSNQTSSPSSEIALLNRAIKDALPSCDLQPINIPREGKEFVELTPIPGESRSELKTKEPNNLLIIDYLLTRFYDVTNSGNEIPKSTDGLLTVNSFSETDENGYFTLRGKAWNFGKMGQVYACNSKGVSTEDYAKWIQDMQDAYESVYGDDGKKCNFQYAKPPLSEKTKNEINNCIEQVESFYDLGFWIIALDTGDINSELVAKQFIRNELNYLSGHTPVGLSNNTVFRFEFGSLGKPDAMDLNKAWTSILNGVQAKDWTSIDTSDMPKINSSPSNILPATFPSWGQYWNDLINPPAEVCGERLKIDELTAEFGDCGKLRVEVFQSDLNTGQCLFLAEWTTSSGSTKYGLFDYCTSFQEASFKEDYSYDVKVRVQGPTTYTTKSGTQNTVLRFEVIK